jgi:hypothetical protein
MTIEVGRQGRGVVLVVGSVLWGGEEGVKEED